MRRVRLLIYDGPEEWLAATRSREFALLGRAELGEDKSITSVEVEGGQVYALVRVGGEVEAVFTSAEDAEQVRKSWPGSIVRKTWLNASIARRAA